jgi:Carboxypeptidase regulatory-like domain/TonB-dependent Receptor Plug Domain
VRKSCLVAPVLCAVFFASLVSAQTDATVSGTVTDPSGAHIIAATVTARNVETGVATAATTNDAGAYTMPSLIPGTYQFTAEHPGFRKAVIDNVILQVAGVLTLNMPLELGQTTESVEVQATATEVTATSSSVGDVMEGKRLTELPLVGRSAYDLLLTQPGVSSGAMINGAGNYYLNGNQAASINFTFDGITAMDNLHNSSFYMYTNIVSVDRAEEFRVVTSPADAEYGRGSGQVQMVTRSGTNRFAGSAWEELRNGDLNANNWFNNAAGSNPNGSPLDPRNTLKQNNYGIRFGGPLKKNKTFFNGIYEPYKSRNQFVANETVYTASALEGNFRFYPGVVNGNVTTAAPTVDSAGNPVQPSAATGGLQTVSVLGRDPNRLTPDPTGIMTHVFSYMPLPNNYRVGDGLNTAGFTWEYPQPVNFELYEGRIDHNFNERERLSLTLSEQDFHSYNYTTPQPFPTAPGQFNGTETSNYSVALTSVWRPNLLNDARIGVYRTRTFVDAPYSPGNPGFTGFLTNVDNYPSIVTPAGTSSPYVGANGVGPVPGDYLNPNYQYGDTVTWIKGRHSFKGGFQLRFISFAGYDFGTSNNVPTVHIGAPVLTPVTNISTGSNPIPGIGQNATTAANLLYDLTGSVNGTTGVTQTDFATGGINPVFLPGLTSYRNWHQREVDGFFKDDFKVSSSLTLNLGVRWELYLPPVEVQGRELEPVGGAGSIFGISGNSLASLFNPTATGGSPTLIQEIGPNTPNPGKSIFNTQFKNFAPAVGLAYAVPGQGAWKWLSGGPNKMTIRIGYGLGYQRMPISVANVEAGYGEPGISSTQTLLTATNLSQIALPLQPLGPPLTEVPLSGAGSHTQTVYGIDPNLRTPYTQNYNVTVARALTSSLILNVAFVGSNSHQLVQTVNINEDNIFENGILQAFNTVLAGGDSPLIDKIFSNSYAAVAAAGSGSKYVLSNSSTDTFFANHNPGGFANFISTTTALSGVAGGLLTNASLPLNYIVANPQFLNAYYTGNFGNSTYNSLQVQVAQRFSHGFSVQGTYVWSQALGTSEGDSLSASSFRTLRDFDLDHRELSFDYQSVFKVNGIYDLPFGRGKLIGQNVNGFWERIIGGWEVGAIGQAQSGSPLTFTAQNTINNTTSALASFTANQVGPLPSDGVQRVGTGIQYFGGFTQITDPAVATLPASLQALSTLKGIGNASGTPILVNPLPGQMGELGQSVIHGPGFKNVNVNMIKRFRINERFNMQIGATAQNLTNTPAFGNPTTSIDSTSFGRITAVGSFASSSIGGVNPVAQSGARIIVLQARVNF